MSEVTHWRVSVSHNHTAEQVGMDCPELLDADGIVRGKCVSPHLWGAQGEEQ
jgi:hypothetical protein